MDSDSATPYDTADAPLLPLKNEHELSCMPSTQEQGQEDEDSMRLSSPPSRRGVLRRRLIDSTQCRETRSRAKEKERKQLLQLKEENTTSMEGVKNTICSSLSVLPIENAAAAGKDTTKEDSVSLVPEENLVLVPVNLQAYPKIENEELSHKLTAPPTLKCCNEHVEYAKNGRCLRKRKEIATTEVQSVKGKGGTGNALEEATTRDRKALESSNTRMVCHVKDRKRRNTQILQRDRGKKKAKLSSNDNNGGGVEAKKSKVALSPKEDPSLRRGVLGTSSKCKRLFNRKISEKIVTKAKGKCKSTGLMRNQRKVNLNGSSKENGSIRKTTLGELRKRAKEYLMAAGWTIDLRPRNGRDYQDSVYISPTGLSFWSLPKAWNVLKQNLNKRFAHGDGTSDLLHKKIEPGNEGSNREDPTKPTEVELHLSADEGAQVSEMASFIRMVYEEDISPLKRKRKDKVDKERNESPKRARHEKLIHYLESRRLLKNKTKRSNCSQLNGMSPELESCRGKSKKGKLQITGKSDGSSLKRRKKNAVPEQSLKGSNITGLMRNVETKTSVEFEKSYILQAGRKSRKLKAGNKSSKPQIARKTSQFRAEGKKSSNGGTSIVVKSNCKRGKKRKKRRGGCGLLVRRSVKGVDHDIFSSSIKRTVLSWLIDVGAVSENELVQYVDKKSQSTLMDGWITRDGILCKCCNRVFTLLDFEAHAGSKLLQPCANIFLASGQSLRQCQMQAWVEQRKFRKVGMCVIKVDEEDQNDDTCGLCGDGGDLICCDKCPSTFHQECLELKDVPDGNWYCPNCVCAICTTIGYQSPEESADTTTVLFCEQCEHKYHKECLHERGVHEGGSMTKNFWFCGQDCAKVFAGLNELLLISNPLEGGFSWTVLRCIEEDDELCSQRLALMAECNTKLAVALLVMEECFVPMVDPRTDLDMIPHVIYNCGSNFSRLNYQRFYTIVLEKGDEVISVASIRIHGTRLAEMPFVGTRHQYRRQGMCRRLVDAIEKMLLSLHVEKLILPAIPDLLETWTKAFFFEPLERSHKEELRNINMMVFPGTMLLQKSIFSSITAEDGETGKKHTDMLIGINNSNLEASAPSTGSELQLHEKSDGPGSNFKSDSDITDGISGTTVFEILPQEKKVSQALTETRNVKGSRIEGEVDYSQSVCSQANLDCPAFIKLNQSIEIVSSLSSESSNPDLLNTSVDNVFHSPQCTHHSVAIENSTAL